MRTTVEIPDELRAKLVAEAARRGEKGYSAVVQRALRAYFEGSGSTERRADMLRRLRGCEAGETSVDAESDRVRSVRSAWRMGRKS